MWPLLSTDRTIDEKQGRVSIFLLRYDVFWIGGGVQRLSKASCIGR
jgi:hypothetical protein